MILANPYFWRTWSQQEIDLIEERDGNLFAYEYKWSKKNLRPPGEFVKAYPEAELSQIHPDNYLDSLT